MRTYEAMFLFDSADAAKDLEGLEQIVVGILERYGAKLRLSGKWDERKLAYPIKKQRRGTYYLAYFDAPADSIMRMREDLLLEERVLRHLFLAMPEDLPVPEAIEVPTPDETEDEKKTSGRRMRRFGRGRCRFTRLGLKYVDWKETQTLSRLCTGQGKMFSRKRSGNSARHQRKFKRAVKYARFMGLMPYVANAR